MEGLVPILTDNPRGVLMVRDELSGWVRSMDQYKQGGKGSDRQFWLQTWSASPASVDRKGSDPLMVKRPSVSIVGGVQPKILAELGEGRDDGFFERFLAVYPETQIGNYTDDDISDAAVLNYEWLMERLYALKPNDFGDPVLCGLSAEARPRFFEMLNDYSAEIRDPSFPEGLDSAWGKLAPAYFARFALLFAILRDLTTPKDDDNDDNDDNSTKVEIVDLEAAAKLIEYFKVCARRVQGQLYGDDSVNALAADFNLLITNSTNSDGCWRGLAKDLYDALPKASEIFERPNEFGRWLRDYVKTRPDLTITVDKHTMKGRYLEIVATV
jgi:hypothetical protein